MDMIFFADTSPFMGTGHVMRCLALALAARESGLGVRMIGRVQVPWVRERLQKEGIPFTALEGDVPKRELPEDLLLQVQDAQKSDWIVLDGYHFGPDCQKAVRQAGYRLLVIDDYNHLPEYHADILLNQNLGAEEFPYSGDVSQKLLGPRYALLRPEFALARKQAEQRVFPEKAQKLLLTLGGGDFSTHLLDIAPVLSLPELADCTLRVISGAMPEEEIRKALISCPAKLEILPRVDDMPALLLDTDLCITAGGSTCWELCCLGVPFLTVGVARNQKWVCDFLEDTDLAPRFSPAALVGCIQPSGRREKISQKGLTLVDGCGVRKIYAHLLGKSYYFRQPEQGDNETIWSLATSQDVRAVSCSTKTIPRNEHEQWFSGKLAEAWPLFLVVLSVADEFLGYVRFTLDESRAFVSIALISEVRGKGLGRAILAEACGLFRLHHPAQKVRALIHPDNTASQTSFAACGFRSCGRHSTGGTEFLELQLAEIQ